MHPNKYKERPNSSVSLLVGTGVPFLQQTHLSVYLRFVVIGAWLIAILASVPKGQGLGLAVQTLGTTLPQRSYELGEDIQRGKVEPVPKVLSG